MLWNKFVGVYRFLYLHNFSLSPIPGKTLTVSLWYLWSFHLLLFGLRLRTLEQTSAAAERAPQTLSYRRLPIQTTYAGHHSTHAERTTNSLVAFSVICFDRWVCMRRAETFSVDIS